MVDAFPTLFTPLQLRHKTLKNRISFGAHTANMSKLGCRPTQHLRLLPGAGDGRCRQ